MSLSIKFYWNTAALIHIYAVSGCFCVTAAELDSYNRDHVACRAKTVYYSAPSGRYSPQPLICIVPECRHTSASNLRDSNGNMRTQEMSLSFLLKT